MRAFLEKWLLPYCIAISIPYLVALHEFSHTAIPAAALFPVAGSLLVVAIILRKQQPQPAGLSGHAGHRADSPACHPIPRLECVPKGLTVRSLSKLYERFSEEDADKIVEPQG